MKHFLDYICEAKASSEAMKLEQKLKEDGYVIRNRKDKQPSNIIVVEIEGANRIQTLDEIAEKYNGERDIIPVKSGLTSSIGCTKVGNVKVLCKSSTNFGSGKAGIENENMLVDAVNAVCNKSNPITLVFNDGKYKFICENVIAAKNVGSDTTHSKKADIMLETSTGKTYKLSIKKDTFEYYASCAKYNDIAIDIIKKCLKNKIVKEIQQDNAEISLSPSIVFAPTQQQAEDAMFGSDIDGKTGCILQCTFTSRPLQQISDNGFECKVSHVVRSLADVIGTDYEPYFYIQNATGHRIKQYIGIRLVMTVKKRVLGGKKNTVIVDKNGMKL